MERLWAPWRSGYIQTVGKKSDCIFCEKAKSRNDRENFILKRGKYCFVILNVYPYNNGHLMIAPYRHISEISHLRKCEMAELFQFLKEYELKLKKKLSPDGFNVGLNVGKVAGAGFEHHIHFHIVPRWEGDTNFMPVISDTKVISQSLEEVYNLLR